MNITKFGAFVNILPGRDGLLHISKIGGGKRVDRVEDVLTSGQDVEVNVDDIDPQGKVSLSLAGDPPPAAARSRAPRAKRAMAAAMKAVVAGTKATVVATPLPLHQGRRWRHSRPAFEAEIAGELGDLGPGPAAGGDRPERPGTAARAAPVDGEPRAHRHALPAVFLEAVVINIDTLDCGAVS